MNRRSFIGAALAAVAGALTKASAPPRKPPEPPKVATGTLPQPGDGYPCRTCAAAQSCVVEIQHGAWVMTRFT